jgi:zinc finger SWIM domain-containing protein 3
MYEYDNESEFEKAWANMIHTYKINDLSWLNSIYKLKSKWAKCFMKMASTLGMRSTQLSESLNADLKNHLKSDLCILQFFQHFERVVEQKRHKELEAEYNARQKLPTLSLKNSPLLKQAAQVYTPAIFKMFQNEYDYASAALIKSRNESQPMHEYIVMLFGQEKEYKVLCNSVDQTIMCSCRKFETFGILCCHALKVFDVLDKKIIPGLYLLKRWTREAKNGYVLDRSGRDVQADVNLDITTRYRRLCPRLVRLASRAADFEEAYVLVERAVNELEKQVEDIAKKSSNVNLDNSIAQVSMLGANELVSHGESFENLVENVKGLKKKEGCQGGKRLRNWVEKQPRRTICKHTLSQFRLIGEDDEKSTKVMKLFLDDSRLSFW